MISQKINLYNLYILHIFRKKSYNKSMKKINIKKLLFYILVPLLSGAIVGFLTSGETKNYNGIVPGFVFPIVWSILYIMLGISSYLVKDDEDLLTIYKVNLIINLAWSFIFFTFNSHFKKQVIKNEPIFHLLQISLIFIDHLIPN